MPTRNQLRTLPAERFDHPASGESVREWIAGRIGADAQLRAAAAQRAAEPSRPGRPGASTDIVQVLTRQHNRVRALQQQLAALPGPQAGGGPDDLAARKSIVDLIAVHLSQHEMAEEEHFWPAVRTSLPDGGEWADRALRQEQEGKEILTELGRLDPGTGEFDELASKLALALRQHMAYEERVFLRLCEAMPEADREKLGKKVLRASRQAPARPHKHAPKAPGAAVRAAPGAAAADRFRDAAGDRPAGRKGSPG